MASRDEVARSLRDAVRHLIVSHGALREARRPCGTPISTSHAWALLELSEMGPMTGTALAERLNIDRTNVSRLCERMVSLGELEKIPHPKDGRAVLLRLTRKGRRVAARVDRTSTRHFSAVAGQLDRVGEVVDVLQQLCGALDGYTEAERCA